MLGLILAAAPVVRVQNYAIAGRVSPKEAISQINKRIDVGTYRFSRGNGVIPFLFTEIYLDTAPNQLTLWGNSHRSLYRNGDTIGVAFRRVEASPGSGRIGAAWSINGGITWNVRGNINYDAGLADAGGRYPNFAGFTTSGLPVVAWPELLPGPAWGKSCIAVVDATPYGVCSDLTASGDSVYHNFAWKVAPDTFAVVGFTTGGGIVGFLFDVATGSIIPGSEVKLRDPGDAEDVSLYDVSLKGDTLYVMGTNEGLGEGDGIVRIFYDGTGLATDPVPPSQGGASVVESHLFCCWGVTIGSNTFVRLGYAAYSFTIDRYGRGWSVYAMKDTLVDPNDGPGHIIVMHRWDDSSLVVFAPWRDSVNVETRRPVYWPRLAVDDTDPNKIAVFWIQYLDTLNYGCATGAEPFRKSIFYAATSDGGATWGININTNPANLADFFFPARDADADYTFSGGLITGVYLTPADNTTDIYCNVIANGTTGSYLHVVTDTISYTSNYPGDTIIVGVDERTKEVTKLAVFRNGIFVSGSAAIYDVKGSLVRKVEGSQFVRLRKGAYFVRVNGRVYKVVIR